MKKSLRDYEAKRKPSVPAGASYAKRASCSEGALNATYRASLKKALAEASAFFWLPLLGLNQRQPD